MVGTELYLSSVTEKKYTPAVRAKISSKTHLRKLCVILRSRVLLGMSSSRVVVVVVVTLTRIIKSVVTRQAPVTLGYRNTPGKNTNTHNPRWYTPISQLTQFMPPPETYKSEIGSQSTMCQ